MPPLQARRPRGVSFLAALEAVGGAICVVLGISYVNALDVIVTELGLSPSSAPDFYTFFIVEVLLGAVGFLLAYGLWTGRRWGVRLTGDVSVASLVYYAGFGSYFIAQYQDYTELTAGVVGLAVALVAAIYVSRPGAKAFSESPADAIAVSAT